MADTDFYKFTTCQLYDARILSTDQATCDQLGVDATIEIQNILNSLLTTVPTGASVTNDQKAWTNYIAVSRFCNKIKDYKGEASWTQKAKDVLETIIKDAKADAEKPVKWAMVTKSYRSSPLKDE